MHTKLVGFISKNEDVILHSGFGNFTYDLDSKPVDTSSIYDIASITKALSVVPLTMKLVERRKLSINNYIYASDMQNGLYIFNFNEIHAGWVDGTIYYNQNIPLSNASIRATLNNKIFYSNDQGQFSFGFPEGNHEFIINESDTITINFLPHETIEEIFVIGNTLMPGDVNQDSNLDILDIIIIINIILDTYSPNIEEIWASDINEDSNINIQDIILLIQFILNL